MQTPVAAPAATERHVPRAATIAFALLVIALVSLWIALAMQAGPDLWASGEFGARAREPFVFFGTVALPPLALDLALRGGIRRDRPWRRAAAIVRLLLAIAMLIGLAIGSITAFAVALFGLRGTIVFSLLIVIAYVTAVAAQIFAIVGCSRAARDSD